MSTVTVGGQVVVCHVGAGTTLTREILSAAMETLAEQRVVDKGREIVFVVDEGAAIHFDLQDDPGFTVRARFPAIPVDEGRTPTLKHGPERRSDWDKGRRPSWKAKRRGRR